VTIAHPFLARAEADPRGLALSVTGGARWTYALLRERALRVAAALRADAGRQGVREPLLGLLLDSRGEFAELFLGAALAGVPVMVLDPSWGEGELSSVLGDTPPEWLVCEPARLDRLRGLFPSPMPMGGAYESWLDGARPLPGELAPVPESAPFYVPFTSGSTGRPKGAVRSHRSWLRTFDRSDREFGIAAGDHILVPGSLTHSHFLYGLLHGLAAGATVHLMRHFDAEVALDLVRRHRIAHVYLVPTMFAALERAGGPPGGAGFPEVRSLLSAGSKWPVESRLRVAELFPGADAVEFYGATELSFVSVLHSGDGPLESVGRPFAGVEIRLRATDGTEAAPGEPGILHVRSDMLFTRYLSAHDAGRPDADGWYTVGDVARLDADGYLHLVGRASRMIVSGGLNVHPEEVETVLSTWPEVAEAAVVGLPDPYWGEVVTAVLRWRDPARLTRAEIRDRAATRLTRAKCPQRIFTATGIPRTPAGKIAYPILRDALLAGAATLQELD